MEKPLIAIFKSLFLFFLLSVFSSPLIARDDTRIWLAPGNSPKIEREVILVLPGLGDSRKGRNAQEKFFRDRGYDVYIPDFLDRHSFAESVKNLARFYDEQGLSEYKKVHVFCYILGAFALNEFLLSRDTHNIATIVYDRSPLQERAPYVVAEAIPGLGRLAVGNVVIDFSEVTYSPIVDTTLKIGIIVESKATRLIRIFKKTALQPGPISWDPADLNQSYRDIHFTRLNHDQMYYRFDVVGEEIFHFIQKAEFSDHSMDMAYTWNPFKPWRQKDEKSVLEKSSVSGYQPSGNFYIKWFNYQ
ncbi:MAG: hypothetical protein SF052_25875 [Bacteroidia bacterium]|nr:hypothetical protein [Bacteroidia bacterium]